MNVKRYLLACLAVYIGYQALAYFVHGVWLDPVYMQHADAFRPRADIETNTWIMFVTSAVWALLFCYIFVRGYENRGLVEGLRYGLLVGLFFSVPQAFDSYVVYRIPYTLALSWFVSGVLMSMLLGLVAAAVYREPRLA